MEERVNKLRRHLHEPWHIGLHGSIDVVILVRCNLEVLLELWIHTVKRHAGIAGREGEP